MTRNQLNGRLLASVLALACAGFAYAGQPPETDSAVDAGMRVFKDPVSGEFREPTAAEVKALNKVAVASKKALAKAAQKQGAKAVSKPLRSLQKSDGTIGMEVPESAYSYVVVTRAADGSLKQACAAGEDAALHAAHTVTVAKETVYETQ